jgi:colicin import membrane protein
MVEALRQYSLPLLFALLLHALALVSLQRGWEPDASVVREIKPSIVMSKLIVLEPKPAPRARPKPATPKPTVAEPVVQKTVPDPVAKPEPKPDPRVAEAAREAAEQRAREEAARNARLAELAAMSSFDDPVDDVIADGSEADEVAAQSFRQGIYQKVVDNWSRPPSARNGMEAELQVELVPTGDVVAVTVIKTSGSTAFDQSAESAVRKARRFEVPKESRLFENRFRKFRLLFRPEDLLR